MPCYAVIVVSTICKNHPIAGGEPIKFFAISVKDLAAAPFGDAVLLDLVRDAVLFDLVR
jgi:hypothetical protein